ncbi:glutamine synthetase/guanido kinase [Hypoxylon sp. FL1284]|nr:glutamine synthetase/guanido kinase [Hypoxylon sp. FL1284]
MASAYDFRHLNAAIDSTSLLDNHAHPLLTPEKQKTRPFLSIASEAGGEALQDSKASLAHVRAVKQLAEVLGCEQTWDAVVANVERKRLESGADWIRRCFEGIETVLIDDGLDVPGRVETYDWHSNFTKSPCKRIVRIETVASDIIARYAQEYNGDRSDLLSRVLVDFHNEIIRYVKDPRVAGFKTIICYRRGLAILPPNRNSIPYTEAANALEEIVSEGLEEDSPVSGFSLIKRLQDSPLNDLVVSTAANAIGSAPDPVKPLQFHTGLGDTDITLTKSSPSHLQRFIEDFPKVPIVLLHAGYPWTRETAYLAAMYPNVYADIGEVIPVLSQQGQENVLKEMLELCPWSKILCSTDAHGFPEMYLIATMQIRSALKAVVGDLVRTGQLDERQGVQLVQAVLHNNSKKVYNLETASTLPSFEQLGSISHTLTTQLSQPSATANDAIIRKLRSLDAKHLRIYWHDYTSSAKCRLIPIKHVYKTLASGKPMVISVAKAGLGLLQTDMLIPQMNASGMYTLRPDWSSLKPGPAPGHVSCFGDFFTQPDGASSAGEEEEEEEPMCPRAVLRRTLDRAASRHGLSFLLGFEVEFVVMERNPDAASVDRYLPLRNDGHAWSMARALADWGGGSSSGGFTAVAAGELLDALDDAGIAVEQFHPEAAPGQYELVLAALPPLEACDSLLHARQVLESVAARHGFRVTLHPKPFGAAACGSASHMHMSLSSSPASSPSDAVSVGPAVYEPFYAGVLGHLRALVAFAYSNPTSYQRMVDSFWAGGRWVTWGTQNKEAPLRKVAGSHWEVKVIDGLANPYFVAAAVLAAGLDGVERRAPLTWRDCLGDPARMDAGERAELGITTMFPADLREALRALADDETLDLDPKFVKRYIDVKTAELDVLLDKMSPEELRRWVLERY